MPVTYLSAYHNRINELEKITQFIDELIQGKEKDQEARLDTFHSTISICRLFANTAWAPFPDYQTLIKKLDIRQTADNLNLTLSCLVLPSKKFPENEVLSIAKAILPKLIAYAHLLNCMDLFYQDIKSKVKKLAHFVAEKFPEAANMLEENNEDGKNKETIQDLLSYAKSAENYDIHTSYKQVTDCDGDSQWKNVDTKPPVKRTIYTMLIAICNTYKDEELQKFTEKLFANFDSINPESVYENTDLSKINIFDNKHVLQKFVIEQINNYKKAYLSFIESLTPTEDNFGEEDKSEMHTMKNKP
jgi:hypothetical protein